MDRMRVSVCSMLVVLALLIGLIPISSALADQAFTVTSSLDLADTNPGDGICLAAGDVCTLRAAVQEANALAGVDTIVVPAGTYVLAIAGFDDDAAATGDLDITEGVVISGSGSATTIVDASQLDRIFHVLTTGAVTISGLTVQNGYAPDGGGIAVESGQVTLSDVIVRNNRAEGGGGIWNAGTLSVSSSRIVTNEATDWVGGGIQNEAGTVVLTNVVVDDNQALVSGGGIITYGGSVTMTGGSVSLNTAHFADGGGILGYDGATVSLDTVDIMRNDAVGGALGGPGADSGGVGVHDGVLTITNSRIEQNYVYGSGGGIFVAGTDFTLDGGTVHQNTARFGGGIYGVGTISNVAITENYVEESFDEGGIGGGIYGGGTLVNVTISGNLVEGNSEYPARGTAIYGSASLINVTIADNVTSPGADSASPIYATGAFEAVNTIVSDASLLGCAGVPVISLGNNLDAGTTCGFVAAGDVSGVDPLLGPLADNGGASLTHALLSGSPAIDAGDNAGCPAIDQRGMSRPFDGDGDGVAVCDIGAYESHEVSEPVDTTPPVIEPVSDLHVTATSRSGAKVVYTAPAYDDAVSGSGTATCTPVSGATFKLGQTTVTCTATDDAGNVAELSFNVYVTYSWSGFLSPINANGNTVRKAGSMLPIKFRLTGESAQIKDANARLTVERVSDGYQPVRNVKISYSGQYMFQWRTNGLAPGDYRLMLNLGDGVTRTAIVTLR